MARTTKSASARPRKKSDASTNARKRYYRAAERNLKKARTSSGATASRYRELARQNFEDALSTYDPMNTQKISAPMRRLAQEFNVDVSKFRKQRLREAQDEQMLVRARNRQRLSISRSMNVLEGNLQDSRFRSELEAREIFNSPIGSRVVGGLVDVWRDVARDERGRIDKGKIIPAIMDYFGVETLAELLEKIESKIGDELYKDPANENIYDFVKLTLQSKVADNTLVD